MREDDAARIVAALGMVKGVLSVKPIEPIRDAVADITGGPTSIEPRFTWIDDGVAGVSSLWIVAPDGEITVERP